jgi:nucleoside diphosphate kinase
MRLLAVLKPDGTLRRAAGAGVLNGLAQSKRCDFLTFRKVRAPIELIERHYGFLKTRSFYPWLEKYMTVIYQDKSTVSQKMCHAAKCFQRMGFL